MRCLSLILTLLLLATASLPAPPAASAGPEYAEAVRYFRAAVAKGSAVGMANLGNAYWDGREVERDYAEAVALYRRSLDAGNPTAGLFLGDAYRQGNGVDQDREEAIELYRKAASEGVPEARKRLEELGLDE